jgi:putative ABC transport system permease protein
VFTLVSGYVFYEKGFDRVFPGNKNIYRVITHIYNGSELSLSILNANAGVSSSLRKNTRIFSAGFIFRALSNPQLQNREEIFTNNQV